MAVPATGPDTDSPAVRTVELRFWKPDAQFSLIEIQVEVTRVACADPMEVRTVDGIIYPTLSDEDLIESKIIAVFGRKIMQHRDLVDIFLFAGKLTPESPRRLKQKLAGLSITSKTIRGLLDDLQGDAPSHTNAIQAVIETQLDREAAKNIKAAGGAKMVLEKVTAILRENAGHGGKGSK